MSLLVKSALIIAIRHLLSYQLCFPLDSVRFNSVNKYLNLIPCIALGCIKIIDGASSFDPEQNQ